MDVKDLQWRFSEGLIRMARQVLILLLALQMYLAAAAKNSFPITIAPDIKVARAEFGSFPSSEGPRQKKGKAVVFRKTDHVKRTGYSYGWRILLDTPRKSVRVYEIWDERESEPGEGEEIEIVDGLIYHDWDVVMGTRKGRHSVEVFVERQPVKRFVYFVH